ncbi:hypothetical protein D918_04576 [Trichuris suis]|nr:hypothetical protein D918_04576 [Trichuris suis]
MVRAWLLFHAGEKKILDANDCDTVESLKKKFAPHFNCDHEQLEALLLAKRLPDNAQLTADAGIDDKAIITLLRKKCPAKVSCSEPPSKEEVENDVRAFREVVFVNEEDVNRQKIYEVTYTSTQVRLQLHLQLRKLTSNIQFVDEMVASIPSLDNDPIVRSKRSSLIICISYNYTIHIFCKDVIHDWPLLLRWTCKPDVYK